VVSANAQENSDLWQSLKGGGSNFGIVTRFDLETHPELLNVNYTINVYDPSDYVNIHAAAVKLQEDMETDPKISFFVNVQPAFITAGLFYAEHLPEGQKPKAFEPFLNLKSLLQSALPTTNGTMSQLVEALGHLVPANR
jgi:hypothetical protein